MASLKSIFSARKTEKNLEVLSDLDELISRSVGFRFQGKLYEIKPLDLEEFFIVSNSLAKLDDLRTKKIKDEVTLLNAYQELFDGIVTPHLDVKKMRYYQVAALFNLILECIMGKAQVDYEKKTLKSTIPTQENDAS